MATYRYKTNTVEAIQFKYPTDEWLEQMNIFLVTKGFDRIDFNDEGKDYIDIDDFNELNLTDWIYIEDGNLCTATNEEFNQLFELVNDLNNINY